MSKMKTLIFGNLGNCRDGLIVGFALLSSVVMVGGCSGAKSASTEAASTAAPANVSATSSNGSAYQVESVTNGGDIEGQVTLNGKPIPPRPVQVNQDASVCGLHREVYPVKLDRGGIVDAVVWIEDIHRGKAYDFPPAALDQQKCTYDPHIVLMQPGDLKVTTSDPVPHNVHSYSEANRTYNESMNPLNREMTFHFVRPERVTFKCDLHGWMEAFIVVTGNPYYTTTKKAGSFELSNVPPGTYQVKVWQETLGETTQSVTVQGGKTTKVNFQFNSPASERAEVR